MLVSSNWLVQSESDEYKNRRDRLTLVETQHPFLQERKLSSVFFMQLS